MEVSLVFPDCHENRGCKNTCSHKSLFTCQDLESVQEGGWVSQAPVFLTTVWAVLGHVPIDTSAKEHLLDAAGEGGTELLNRIHHHWAIECRS